jgi:hypothetical protein
MHNIDDSNSTVRISPSINDQQYSQLDLEVLSISASFDLHLWAIITSISSPDSTLNDLLMIPCMRLATRKSYSTRPEKCRTRI